MIPYAGDLNDSASQKKLSKISKRYLTWTDIFYIAAEECATDKYEWITRYPISSFLGTFPSKIHVMSTARTMKCTITLNGYEKTYNYYPIVDLDMPSQDVGRTFNETVNMDNMRLKIIGGDYDGDTISERAPFTSEANQECLNILRSNKNYLNCSADMLAVMTNEGNLTLFNMTRDQKYTHMELSIWVFNLLFTITI